ncbi:hypothetical protein Q670_11485 [Alcanivorax sp. P2S70]|uniref:DUF3426 domain-containing protein n=1 Tax=Alcanivorax sp. P2S70 TaxID=1397527 RepID=UPI0003B4098F|nr:DUF3426 domain-containing protein [Alcanivorax sp. P2S70]ERP91925.1 hypothetical protein Q670_11485 [Alcanivorax sp. P2S70]
MSTQYKTRCPHCAAQFKITDEHLKQARGAVRCGSCLQVFQATDYLVNPPEQPADQKDRWAGALDGNPQQDPPSAFSSGSLDLDPEFEDQDDHEGHADSGLSIEGMELSDSFMNLGEDGEEGLGEDFADMHGAGRASHNEGADEAWAEALLQELEDEPDPVRPEDNTPGKAVFAPLDDPGSKRPAPSASPTKEKTPPKPKAAQASSRDDDSLFGGLDLFGDELPETPVTIKTAAPLREREAHFRRQRDWSGLAKWGALSALAMVLLASQYSYFNFDQLARTPQWRPAYQQLCSVLGCQLPNRSDLSKMRGANLVVRSHPQFSNSLVVDAILFNEARYPQPFPDLELTFSSLNGKAIAGRRFKPDEYLHGDLAGMDTMPTHTPLHVSLEIVDPGDQAVNYNLRLLASPESAGRPDA